MLFDSTICEELAFLIDSSRRVQFSSDNSTWNARHADRIRLVIGSIIGISIPSLSSKDNASLLWTKKEDDQIMIHPFIHSIHQTCRNPALLAHWSDSMDSALFFTFVKLNKRVDTVTDTFLYLSFRSLSRV